MVILILCTSPSTEATLWGVFSSRNASSVTSVIFAFDDAAIPVLPINETVRRITVEKTNVVDRRGLYSVQTPQGFRPELIFKASSKAKSKNTEVTDDASLLEKIPQKVASVEGEVHNIKITTPADLEHARWIINSMNHVRIK